jgi:hypothetical protein
VVKVQRVTDSQVERAKDLPQPPFLKGEL